MTTIPTIVVQLIHIDGPLKGEIQEFLDPEISMGRHPSCHVLFPKEFTSISRKHARIVREGNRFKLIDQSANGTFVNGKRETEVYLKSGDVIIFAEGGPKVSFLTRVEEGQAQPQAVAPSGEPFEAKLAPTQKLPSQQIQGEPETPLQVSIQKVQVSLIIQYGPTLRSFKELPVTIGKNPSCDLSLEHPQIRDKHAQFFFDQGQYWVKDMTGQHMILIDGQPIDVQASLNPNSTLSFSSQGPTFRFLGGGRLAELEEPASEESESEEHEKKTEL
jgi:pSer/pThr/pTyr-binding forkhead associated (FHA) protein